jgi:hypothetical protein
VAHVGEDDVIAHWHGSGETEEALAIERESGS